GVVVLIVLRSQPPPTLFPYTTLFRSRGAAVLDDRPDAAAHTDARDDPEDHVLRPHAARQRALHGHGHGARALRRQRLGGEHVLEDRKSTRLNSSHGSISYAVFCLKKK